MGKKPEPMSEETFRFKERLFNGQKVLFLGTYIAACYGDGLGLSNNSDFHNKVIAESLEDMKEGGYHVRICRRDCHDGQLHVNIDNLGFCECNGTFFKEILPNDKWHRANRLPPNICFVLGCGTCGYGTTVPEGYEIAPCGFSE